MLTIGEIIDGRYQIHQLIGQGGMAAVYRVLNIDLQRYEALKMPSTTGQQPEFSERFLDEARTVARLQHPNIAAIHTVSGAGAAQPYFTMEIVDGGDLSDLILQRGYLPLNEAVPILKQIAAALDFAHQHGLMHRDIKPANILLKPGSDAFTAKVVDFGISKAVEETGGKRLTRTGMIIGTPEYMSPEQAGSGALVDQRTDQYSLAVMAYEMLCGTPPFKQESNTSMMSVMMKHVRDEPLAPSQLNSTLSPSVDTAILRSLAKNPADRFDTCREFVEALLTPEPPVPPPITEDKGTTDGTKSTFTAVHALLVLIVIAGVGLIGYGLSNYFAPQERVAESMENPDIGDTPASPTQPVQVQVPNFVGESENDATNWLRQNSLQVNKLTGNSTVIESGNVMSQSPSFRAMVDVGSTVTIRVSEGIKPAPAINWVTYSDNLNRWEIKCPSDWTHSMKYYPDDANRTRHEWDAPSSNVSIILDISPDISGKSALADWQDFDRRFRSVYGDSYRLINLEEDQLGGQSGARWEYTLQKRDQPLLRKIDRGASFSGAGYALLFVAPVSEFDNWRGIFDEAYLSFRFINQGY